MPTITPDAALLLAADKLVDTIRGIIPKTTVTKDAIAQLMAIFRDKAMVASDATSAQRVLRKIAATKRAQAKEIHTGSQRVEIEDNGSGHTRAEYREEPNLTNFELDTSCTPT